MAIWHELNLPEPDHIFIFNPDSLCEPQECDTTRLYLPGFGPNSLEHARIIPMKDKVCFDEVVYAGGMMKMEYNPGKDPKFLEFQDLVFEKLDLSPKLENSSKQLFCYSERLNTTREILNRDDIWNMLQRKFSSAFDFRMFNLVDFSMRDQLSEVMNCDVYFGPHGQNLLLSIFSKRSATLIEAWPTTSRVSDYQMFASYAGIHHKSLNCEKRGQDCHESKWRSCKMQCKLEDIEDIILDLLPEDWSPPSTTTLPKSQDLVVVPREFHSSNTYLRLDGTFGQTFNMIRIILNSCAFAYSSGKVLCGSKDWIKRFRQYVDFDKLSLGCPIIASEPPQGAHVETPDLYELFTKYTPESSQLISLGYFTPPANVVQDVQTWYEGIREEGYTIIGFHSRDMDGECDGRVRTRHPDISPEICHLDHRYVQFVVEHFKLTRFKILLATDSHQGSKDATIRSMAQYVPQPQNFNVLHDAWMNVLVDIFVWNPTSSVSLTVKWWREVYNPDGIIFAK